MARMYDAEGRIALALQAEGDMNLDTAVPCGLILTELVANAFKYAFPEGRQGRIGVTLQPEAENRWLLVVQDNGIGLPSEVDIADTESLGLTLVHDLVNQLGGSVQVDCSQGTAFTIRFTSPPSLERYRTVWRLTGNSTGYPRRLPLTGCAGDGIVFANLERSWSNATCLPRRVALWP
jgi:two-component sensor histidine kinase